MSLMLADAGAAPRSDRLQSFASKAPAAAWALLALAYYVPLLALRVLVSNDVLDSELVYNVAAGAVWRGDPSIAHAFLNGHVPVLALERLTQPLTLLYALLPPFSAFVANDFIVRSVAAAGTLLLLRKLDVPLLHRHLLAAMFAIGITSSILGLTIGGIPLALYLLTQPNGVKRNAGLLLIGWNTAIYLSGIFVVAAFPLFQMFIMRRPMDRTFWIGLVSYGVGLVFGAAGLILLELLPHPVWHRAEWGVIGPPVWPFPAHLIGRPLRGLFVLAVIFGWRSKRVWSLAAFGVFILAWYRLFRQPWFQLHQPFGIQLDRIYFLWPVVLLLMLAIASRVTNKFGRNVLAIAIIVGSITEITMHPHIRQLGRMIIGREQDEPSIEQYYHVAWYRAAHIDGPVISIGTDPMAAPYNRVPSIDGFFNLYPLAYKHAFQRVYNSSLINRWGSKLYAGRNANLCAARALGARYVVSAVALPLPQIRGGELNLYRIDC